VWADQVGLGRQLAVTVGFLVFCGGYAALVLTRDRPMPTPLLHLCVAGFGLLAAALLLDRPGWLAAFVFVAAIAPVRLPTGRAIGAIVVVAAIGVAEALALGGQGDVVGGNAMAIVSVGFVSLTISRLLLANRALLAAREDVARLAVADERLRFARDLHDLLGHSLSVIVLKSEVAARVLDRGDIERTSAELREIQAVARRALTEAREAVAGYRRPTLDNEIAAARQALAAAGIAYEDRVEPETLAPEVEAVLAWAVREGVTNVVRHSAARRCRVTVARRHDEVVARIDDDGPGTAGGGDGGDGGGLLAAEVHRGNGLDGMAERAARVGGELRAGPGPEGGFRLEVRVPARAA
jgi:two-component system sensor histidine kinase DesK